MEENIKPRKSKSKVKNIILIVLQAIVIAVCLVGAIFIMINHRDSTKDPSSFNTRMMVVVTDSMEPTINVNDMIFSKKYKEKTILDLGTVVTYAVKSGNTYKTITHRIVGYYFYLLQGDNKSPAKIYGNKFIISFEDVKRQYNDQLEFVGYLTRGDKYTLEHNETLDDYAIKNEDGSINYSYDDGYYSFLTNDQILSVWKESKSAFLGNIVIFFNKPNHVMLVIVFPIILLIIYNMVIVIREIIKDKHDLAKAEALKKYDIDEEEIKRKAIEEYLASNSKKEDE